MEPLVSVVLPVYNGSKYIRAALESVLKQTYKNIEVVVVDDGSVDNTVEIIRSYTDPRIKLVVQPKNGGIVHTLNTGIDNASGEFTARMDADDICLPERFRKQVDFLLSHPEIAVVDTIVEFIDGEGNSMGRYNNNIVGEDDVRKAMLMDNCINHPSIMIRTAEFKKYRYRKIWYEDDDLWLRMLNDGKRIYKIAEPLLLYRIHQSSIMTKDKNANINLQKHITTRWHYYSTLSIKDKLKPMNMTILAGVIKQAGVLQYKRLKGMFR